MNDIVFIVLGVICGTIAINWLLLPFTISKGLENIEKAIKNIKK